MTILATLVAVFATAFALCSPGFHSRMIYDSVGFIAENEPVFARAHIMGVFGIVPARPLFMLPLYMNCLWAGMDPYFFRVVNAFILAAAGTSLVVLVTFIFEGLGRELRGTNRKKRAVAIFLGLWFVVHPLHNLVVLYIWQREAILACFFFSATAAYMAGRLGRSNHPLVAYALTGGLFLAELACKENVVSLPVVLFLVEWVLLRQGLKQLLRRAMTIALITLPALACYLILIHNLHVPEATYTQGEFNRLQQYYQAAGITPVEVLLNQSRILFSYLFAIIAPFWAGARLIAPELISRSPFETTTLASAAAGLIL